MHHEDYSFLKLHSPISLLFTQTINPYYYLPPPWIFTTLAHSSLNKCGPWTSLLLTLSILLGPPIPSDPPLAQLVVSLKNTKLTLKLWNKNVFGSLQKNISHTKAEIELLQNGLQSNHNLQKVKTLQLLLDTLLKKEELMWREKSKEHWLEEGDTNLRYFHLSTIIRRRYNHIYSLFDPATGWKKDFYSIGNLFLQYFQNLFSSSSPSFPYMLDNLIVYYTNALDTDSLLAIPTAIEVRNTVFSMDNGKSPDPNDMSPTFFKHYWPTIRAKVIVAVQYFFTNGHMLKSLNHTFIALVPKKDNPIMVEHFRPISLCNVAYKIITKSSLLG